MVDPGVDRDAAVQAGVDDLSHFIERFFEEDAADLQPDFGFLKPIELVQNRLHRLARAYNRGHPVDRNLQLVQAGALELSQEFAGEEKAIGRHADFGKPDGFGITNERGNLRMLERLAALKANPG